MRILKVLLASAMPLVLAACFGSSTDASGTGPEGSTQSGLANPIQLSKSSLSVGTGGSESVTITATVQNDDNVVVADRQVSFSADSGNLQVTQATTDAAGQATAELSPGANQRERTITVTASARGETNQIEVPVRGNTLTLSGPDTIQTVGSGTFTARLTDSTDAPITGVELSASLASGAGVTPSSATTDSQGRAQFEVSGVSGRSSDGLTVTGFGERAQSSYQLKGEVVNVVDPAQDAQLAVGTSHTVTAERLKDGAGVGGVAMQFSVSRGRIVGSDSVVTSSDGQASVDIQSPDAGPVTVTAQSGGLKASRQFRYVGVNPANIVVTTAASNLAVESETTVTAEVTDADQNAVADATVVFNLTRDKSNGSLEPVRVTTGADGVAETTFQAGEIPAGEDSVEIEAKVDGTAISDTTALSVTGSALSVALGTGNELFQPNPTDYEVPFSVVVKNSSGQPAEGQDVSLSVEGVAYRKGYWGVTADDEWATVVTVTCQNEDFDRDNDIDEQAGEDADGDGKLEPNLPGLTQGTVTTDSSGQGSFRIIYSEAEARWVKVRVKASVSNSAGTAFTDNTTLILPALGDDTSDTDSSPPGGQLESRYGGYDGDVREDLFDPIVGQVDSTKIVDDCTKSE